MIGVRFEYDVSKVGNCFLHTILDKVDVDKYVWNINFDDIYLVPCKGNDYLFHSKILDGTNFLERISKAQYVVIQCNLQAFPTIDSVTDLNTFMDYQKSRCQLVVVVTDNRYVGILSKDERIVKQIYKNAYENIFIMISFKNDLDFSNYLSEM